MFGQLRKRIVIIFALALCTIAGIGWLFNQSTGRLVAAAQWVSHTREVIADLEDILSNLKDMETGARGYVIGSNASFLKPFWAGTDLLDRSVTQVRSLTRDNPAQQHALDLLEPLLNARVELLQEIVDVHRTRGFEESATLVRSNRGTQVMDQIRAVLEGMKKHERMLLEKRLQTENNAARQNRIITALGIALACLLLAGSFYLLQQETGQRLRVERENRANLERIRDLYHNAPCGYHALDKRGIFLEINETERAWLGFSRDEIIGRLHFKDILTPQSALLFAQSFPKFMAEGRVRELEMELLQPNGAEPRTVLITATAIFDEEHHYVSSRSTMFDISERKVAEKKIDELSDARERNAVQLQAANSELEAFSYTVSHDLRSPLRHLDGFVQLLHKHNEASLDERGRRYLQIISDAARQMGQLIDDLLVFAKMGRTDLATATVDFNAMLREIIAAHAPEYAGREISWDIANLPTVKGDPAMLRVVWTNLVANAIKYTRPKVSAKVKIGWEPHERFTCFFIEDNGVGFDMEHASKLFGVFQRLHRAEDFEGTGIGLASVKRIVHRHGGKTMAEGAVGRGTKVCFLLPNT